MSKKKQKQYSIEEIARYNLDNGVNFFTSEQVSKHQADLQKLANLQKDFDANKKLWESNPDSYSAVDAYRYSGKRPETLEDLYRIEKFNQDAKNTNKIGLGVLGTAALMGVGAGAFGAVPADVVNTYFAGQGVYNAASNNGIAKTVRLAHKGDTYGAIKSGLGDVLDLTMSANTLRTLNRLGKSINAGKSIGNAYRSDIAGRELTNRVKKAILNPDVVQRNIEAGKLGWAPAENSTLFHQSETPLTKLDITYPTWDVTERGAPLGHVWLASEPASSGFLSKRPFTRVGQVNLNKPMVQLNEALGNGKNASRNDILRFAQSSSSDGLKFSNIADNNLQNQTVYGVFKDVSLTNNKPFKRRTGSEFDFRMFENGKDGTFNEFDIQNFLNSRQKGNYLDRTYDGRFTVTPEESFARRNMGGTARPKKSSTEVPISPEAWDEMLFEDLIGEQGAINAARKASQAGKRVLKPITEAEKLGIPKSLRADPKALEDPYYWGYEQWNQRYNDAVKAGNIEEAQRLRDLHFQIKAINNQLQVDGHPITLYHGNIGSDSQLAIAGYNPYSTARTKVGSSGYFTVADPQIASTYKGPTGSIKTVYGYSKNPAVYDAEGRNWQNAFIKEVDGHKFGVKTDAVVNSAFGGGHDAMVIDNVVDYGFYTPASHQRQPFTDYVFKPGNVKLKDAVVEDGLFFEPIPIVKRDNFHNPDIRYKQGGKIKLNN